MYIKKIYVTLLCFLCCITGSYAKDHLKKFPKNADPKEIGLRIVNKYLASPHSLNGDLHPPHPPHQITYPDVCTWLGGLWFAETIKDQDLHARLEERFQPLFDEKKNLLPRPVHVDNNVFGAVPLELYKKNPQEKYLKLGLMYADTQWDVPKNANQHEKKWAEQGYSWQTRIWIDDMFMITTVQMQAYRVTGKTEYLDRAAKEMVMYLKRIQQPSGMFYHAPDTPFFWARGNGWMAVGMAEMLRILPENHPDRAPIMDAYLLMMDTLLKHQAEDGMWRQLIDDPRSWKETSSTGMFAYAMILGVKNGWLDADIYGKAARKAWISLVTYINENDELTEVCQGTGTKNSYQYYLDRRRIVGDLHGQAPLIWCANALLAR